MAIISGPLCEEPIMGCCYIVEEITVNTEEKKDNTAS